MVLHIYSLLPTPVPIYGIKTLFKVYKHQLKVCQALHAVPLLDTVHIIPIILLGPHVTTAWRILSLQMEETTSSYGG
jgi:hypothetical protein